MQDSQDETRAGDEDGEVLYQTIGEASISMPTYTPESSEEATTTPDSVPSTPVEDTPMFSPVSVSSSMQDTVKPEIAGDTREADEQEQENIPPFAAFQPKEMDNAKTVGLALPKTKPRTAHVRSNSTLGESLTGSNIPMRKARRGV